MSIGIFGGTFDPVHNGHIITTIAVKEIRNLEKIFFIPAYIAPHKTDMIRSDGSHRLNMIKLALKKIDGFEYSDFELKSEGVSYTINTIKEFKKVYADIDLIIGYDNLPEFTTWKDPDEIFRFVNVIVMRRRTDTAVIKNKYFDQAVFVDTPLIDISGTEIRRRVKEGLPVNSMVPDAVREYIYKNNLYKEKD